MPVDFSNFELIFFSDKKDADAISSELFRKSSEHLWCFFGRCRNTFGNFTKPGAKRLIFLFQVNLTLALPHANTSMGKQILNIWNGILFISVFIVGDNDAANSCPSLPITYASDGDNVTLCWRIIVNASSVNRYIIKALKRPIQTNMDEVASANGTGHFEKVYAKDHDGLYFNKVTVFADLSAGMLYLRIKNYTRKMDNVYCVLYNISDGPPLEACHSQALLLRNVDHRESPVQTTTTMTTETTSKTTTATITTATITTATITTAPATENTEITEVTTEGSPTVQPYRTALIIMSCLFAIALILAIFGFVLCCCARKSHQANLKSDILEETESL